MSRLTSLVDLPVADRRALLEAAWYLLRASASLRVLPFATIAPRLGRHMTESSVQDDPLALRSIERIRWAIGLAAPAMPWRPQCFPRALCAQWMLRRRGIPSTLYLGVDPRQAMEAHAWVRAGSVIVSGGPEPSRFIPVSTFA